MHYGGGRAFDTIPTSKESLVGQRSYLTSGVRTDAISIHQLHVYIVHCIQISQSLGKTNKQFALLDMTQICRLFQVPELSKKALLEFLIRWYFADPGRVPVHIKGYYNHDNYDNYDNHYHHHHHNNHNNHHHNHHNHHYHHYNHYHHNNHNNHNTHDHHYNHDDNIKQHFKHDQGCFRRLCSHHRRWHKSGLPRRDDLWQPAPVARSIFIAFHPQSEGFDSNCTPMDALHTDPKVLRRKLGGCNPWRLQTAVCKPRQLRWHRVQWRSPWASSMSVSAKNPCIFPEPFSEYSASYVDKNEV